MALKGGDKHIQRLKRLSGPEVIRAAERVLFVGADMIRAHAHQGISRGSVSGKGHVASSPGQFPNRDSGVLQAQLTSSLTGPLEAKVEANAPYSAALEFGTSKMAARPFLRPSRDAESPKIRKLFAKEIGKLIERSG